MEDFLGAVIVLIISAMMFTSCSYGESNASKDIINQCDDFNKFSYDGGVYDCKLTRSKSN